MKKITIVFILLMVQLSFAKDPERTIQSMYSGFTKSCIAFNYFKKKQDLSDYINAVEKYFEKTPDYELNQRLQEQTEEMAQIKLFSPFSFFKPRRSVGGYVNCNRHLDLYLATDTKKEGLEKLSEWEKCVSDLAGVDSHETRIARQVLECMKN